MLTFGNFFILAIFFLLAIIIFVVCKTKTMEEFKSELKNLLIALFLVSISFIVSLCLSFVFVPVSVSTNLITINNSFMYIFWFLVSTLLNIAILGLINHVKPLNKNIVDKMKLFSQLLFFGIITYFSFMDLDYTESIDSKPQLEKNEDFKTSLKVLPVIISIGLGSYAAVITYLFKDKED